MKKEHIFMLLIPLFLIGCQPKPTEVSPGLGCIFMPNEDNPSLIYSDVINGNSFICDVDECIVSGSMTIDNPITSSRVIFRTDGEYSSAMCVGYDFDNDGLLDGKTLSVTISSSQGFIPDYIRSDGLGFRYKDGKVQVGYTGSKQYRSTGSYSCNIETSTDPITTCQSPEVCDTSPRYEATFNFCPTGVDTFGECSGTSNYVSSPEPVTVFTSEYKLIRNQQVTFNPQNSDNTDITDRYIRVKRYDCTCQNLVESGDACTVDQQYCTPQMKTIYYCGTSRPEVSERCDANCDVPCIYEDNYDSYGTDRDEITGESCRYKYVYTCDKLESRFYLICDETQIVGKSVCGEFNTEKTCPLGQYCFVSETGELGTGLGGCRCPDDPCTLGERKRESDISYRECVPYGSCLDWSIVKYCNSGLIYNDILQSCVCDSINSCNPQEAECIGLQIRKCEPIAIGDKTCYKWGTIQNCPGDYQCDNRGTPYNDDACNCNNVNVCSIGDIKCIDSSTYSQCMKDPYNPETSCLKYRGIYDIDFAYECTADQIVERSDIGCAWETPGYECSSTIDIRGVLVEQCIENQCRIIQDSFTATQDDYSNQNRRCYNSYVQEAVRYAGNFNVAYRWEDKINAVNSVNGRCTGDYLCKDGKCVASYEYVGIYTEKDEYGIGELINNVDIVVTSNIGDNKNIRVIARILENGIEIPNTRKDTLTNSDGELTLNFNYWHPRSGTITIEVIVGDPAGINFKATKDLLIKKTLNIKINCPIQAYISREATCTWKVEDKETGTLIDVIPQITLLQGINELPYSPIGRTGLTFKTDTIGNVFLKISAESEGYIKTTSQSEIAIQPLQRESVLEIDNQDFFEYSGSGITQGTHKLEFIIEESGEPIEVQSIDATIRTPSSQLVTLYFTKTTDGVYKTTYTFQQAGQTYDLSGVINFVDLTKPGIPFNYKIVTIESIGEQEKNLVNYLIIGGAVIIIFVLVIIIMNIVKKKKPRGE